LKAKPKAPAYSHPPISMVHLCSFTLWSRPSWGSW